MHDTINTISGREKDRARLARAIESHTRSGGAVTEPPGYAPKPLAPRRGTAQERDAAVLREEWA